jgi:hypothetical protein
MWWGFMHTKPVEWKRQPETGGPPITTEVLPSRCRGKGKGMLYPRSLPPKTKTPQASYGHLLICLNRRGLPPEQNPEKHKVNCLATKLTEPKEHMALNSLLNKNWPNQNIHSNKKNCQSELN